MFPNVATTLVAGGIRVLLVKALPLLYAFNGKSNKKCSCTCGFLCGVRRVQEHLDTFSRICK